MSIKYEIYLFNQYENWWEFQDDVRLEDFENEQDALIRATDVLEKEMEGYDCPLGQIIKVQREVVVERMKK
jgi:hypothetical protein